MKQDPTAAKLNERERVMVDYAIKLTREPCSCGPRDLESLRGAGLDDRAILDLVQVISYFNFVNRLACGTGVELEAGYCKEDSGH